MAKRLVVALGRAVRAVARWRGGGTALPGLVVERVSPTFMADVLGTLPQGVVLVSGTNGKTTTTKIIADLLRAQGLRVFTNPTGSNFTRGVVASLLDHVDSRGRLTADVAVLELDEAYAVRFVAQVRPRVSVLLNVMRDQLDRFGEIDTTAKMLTTVAQATTDTVVLNRDDPRIAAIAGTLGAATQVRWFGVAPQLASLFPDDDSLHADLPQTVQGSSPSAAEQPIARPLDVELTQVTGSQSTYRADGTDYAVQLRLVGIHNSLNAAAALAAARAVLGVPASQSPVTPAGETSPGPMPALMAALSQVDAAFGRGERITVGGATVQLLLVKNPAGFRASLLSPRPAGAAVMIAINDDYADGRDVSWLWDVDFTSLADTGVAVVSGVRAWDMALRLRYDDVTVGTVEPDLPAAIDDALRAHPDGLTAIFCTYTAMLAIRKALASRTNVTRMGESA